MQYNFPSGTYSYRTKRLYTLQLYTLTYTEYFISTHFTWIYKFYKFLLKFVRSCTILRIPLNNFMLGSMQHTLEYASLSYTLRTVHMEINTIIYKPIGKIAKENLNKFKKFQCKVDFDAASRGI